MSWNNLNDALRLIEANPSRGHFAGPKSSELVEKAEVALGLRFPRSYRDFVTKLGCGSIGGYEVYGITTDNFERASVPNGIWLTLEERESSGLPDHLIIVYGLGDGTYYALDTSQTDENGECPIVAWPVGGTSDTTLEIIADDFGAFILSIVRRALL